MNQDTQQFTTENNRRQEGNFMKELLFAERPFERGGALRHSDNKESLFSRFGLVLVSIYILIIVGFLVLGASSALFSLALPWTFLLGIMGFFFFVGFSSSAGVLIILVFLLSYLFNAIILYFVGLSFEAYISSIRNRKSITDLMQ